MPSDHAVVDGSNLATEGRSDPSLAQLEEAVAAFSADHDFKHVTVVVDASFEHRVSDKERPAAKKAIDEGRIIAPPAGVVGRGDAFILQIADRAGAVVVSNDSFQEFHGRFDWLLDEGRLIGGKPVEHVGWIFVPRVPVRGPASRKSLKAAADVVEPKPVRARTRRKKAPASATGADRDDAAAATGTSRRSGDAGPSSEKKAKRTDESPVPARSRAKTAARGKSSSSKSQSDGANPVRAWQRFRRENPVGATVEATIERFSSHGAYAATDEGLAAYLPSRLLGDPPPNRARDVVSVGDRCTFFVHEYHDDRRGIDLGLVPVDGARSTPEPSRQETTAKRAKRSAKRSAKAAQKSTKATKAARQTATKSAKSARSASKPPDDENGPPARPSKRRARKRSTPKS